MQNKKFKFGPVALTTTMTTNILNPPATSGGTGAGAPTIRIILKHIAIVNKTASPATFSLWLGATGVNAAGTEVIGTGKVVAANDTYHWYGELPVDVADFLVGGAGTATALTIQGEGEIGIA
jgi:hypothetical protein